MLEIAGKKKVIKNGARANTMGRFETDMATLTEDLNFISLEH